jgi:hypothetical protein
MKDYYSMVRKQLRPTYSARVLELKRAKRARVVGAFWVAVALGAVAALVCLEGLK